MLLDVFLPGYCESLSILPTTAAYPHGVRESSHPLWESPRTPKGNRDPETSYNKQTGNAQPTVHGVEQGTKIWNAYPCHEVVP